MSDKSGGKPIPTNLADFDFSNIPSDIQSILDDTSFPDPGSHGTGHSLESITQDMLQQGDAMSINDLLGGHHTPNMQNQPMSGNGSSSFPEQSNASNAMQSPTSDGSGGRMPNSNRSMLSSSPIVSSPMVKHEDALSPHSAVSMSPTPSPSRSGAAVLTPRPGTPNVGTVEGTPEINPADACTWLKCED
jgi:hypothetical protein